MTPKNHAGELSEKAKAFSVESLLGGGVKSAVGNAGRKPGGKRESDSEVQTRGRITAELCCSDLWEKFDRLATEMIVTKAGRRMFPTLRVRLHGLDFTATYIVYMDITLADETRYRYNFQRSEWTVAGPSNTFVSNSVYVHPSSPARGDAWMSQESISFDKVKLTNHRKPVMKNQISLHSMHKYQPRIHILRMHAAADGMTPQNILEYIQTHSGRSETFAFRQTVFITVTAYQNHHVTQLKIQSNPFAKGFRETSVTKRERERRWSRFKKISVAYPDGQKVGRGLATLETNDNTLILGSKRNA